MSDEIISIRLDRGMKEKMKMYEHINWSALVRKALMSEIRKMYVIDRARAEMAAKDMDELRKIIKKEDKKSGAEIIREWRNKRR